MNIHYHRAFIKSQRAAGLRAYKTRKYPTLLVNFPMANDCYRDLKRRGLME